MQPSIAIMSFLIGLVIGFWVKGQFRDFFATKKEYHIHMATAAAICILGLSLIFKYKQYFFV